MINRKINNTFNCFVLVAAFLGCFCQLYDVSNYYFSYETNSIVEQRLPRNISPPNLAICYPYDQIFDRNLYKLVTGQTLPSTATTTTTTTTNGKMAESSGGPSAVHQFHKMVNMVQVFNFTPEIENALDKCSIIKPHFYTTIDRSNNLCLSELFHMSKFYTQESVCYDLKSKIKQFYHFFRLSNSILNDGLFYQVYLRSNSSFTSTTKVKPIVYYGDYPYTSRSCSSFVSKSNKIINNFTIASYKLKLIFATTTINRLPKPYKTACVPEANEGNCLYQCLTQNVTKILARLPFNLIHPDFGLEKNLQIYAQLQHITEEDLQNVSISDKLFRAEDYCLSKCSGITCFASYTVTEVAISEKTNQPILAVHTPRKATVSIICQASILLTEYLILCASCFNFWFGLSALSLNPVKLLQLMSSSNKGTKVHHITRHSFAASHRPVTTLPRAE